MEKSIKKTRSSAYQIKPLLFQDIPQAIKLSNAEKWNQKEEDWTLLIQNPKNICLAAVDEEKIIGTGTAIIYANKVAWIGMILVEQSHRGRGVSKSILLRLFEHLNFIPSVKLDATPAGQAVYQKFGFKDEYIIHRMTTTSLSVKSIPTEEGISLEPVQLTDIPEIVEYDSRIFGASRKQLIEFLIKNYPHKSWLLRRNREIEGFTLGRDGTRFNQIGPVMASSPEISKKLVVRALRDLKDKPVVIDVLDDKNEMITWLKSIGFDKKRHFIRMYQNENSYPGVPKNQYLICGPEFG